MLTRNASNSSANENGQVATVESFDPPIRLTLNRDLKVAMEVFSMITETTEKSKSTRKPKSKQPERQHLEPTRIYSRKDLAAIFGAHPITFLRAYRRDHLEGCTVGRLVFHTGEQVMRWLEAGGRTA